MDARVRALTVASAVAVAVAAVAPASASGHAIIAKRGSTLAYFSIDEVSRNTLTIERRGGVYRVTDPTLVGGIDPGPCVPMSENAVECPVDGIATIHVETGAFDDSITLRGVTVRTELLAGPDGDIVNGGAGDDLVDAGAGNDTVDGGGGSDQVLGMLGDDRLAGGIGADIIDGGGGRDILDGGPGDDALLAGDGVADMLTCGDGAMDRADADSADVLTGGFDAGCEQLTRLAAPGFADRGDTAAPVLQLEGVRRQRLGRRNAVRVRALANEPSAVAFTARLRVAGRRRTLAIRRVVRQVVRAGDQVGADLRLGPKARAAVRGAARRGRSTRVVVSAVSRDNAGNVSRLRTLSVRVLP